VSAGYDRDAAYDEERWHEGERALLVEDDPLPGEPWTELGYARRLIHAYGDRLRFVTEWHRWLAWDGVRWVHDDAQAARWQKVIARRLTNCALAVPDEAKRKNMLHATRRGESSAGVAGALKLASTEKGIAIGFGDLDADPFLVNCPNGVLDLRTGQIGEHNPALLLTKTTRAAYRPGATGAVFGNFLRRVQPEDAMREFLPRLLGHALEGRVVEHVLPIFHGTGANGKSTLVDAVLFALGDYADVADPELLTARTFDAHPTGNADLFGLRLAVLHESDQGRRLAEGTVKRLTGGDRVKARRMREDFWSFDPTHIFVMLTNHKPLVRGTDEGIWRRLRLIPFEVTIPEPEQDEHLREKLQLEADAVLARGRLLHVACLRPGRAGKGAQGDRRLPGRVRRTRAVLGRTLLPRPSPSRPVVGPLHRVARVVLPGRRRRPGLSKGLQRGLAKQGFRHVSYRRRNFLAGHRAGCRGRPG
jgi:putative DNA primase/helicase